jgi:hypothetical protein
MDKPEDLLEDILVVRIPLQLDHFAVDDGQAFGRFSQKVA